VTGRALDHYAGRRGTVGSPAVALHEAAAGKQWKIGQRDVAINSLIVAGLDEASAVEVIRRQSIES
jgi:hypothetical protein